MELDLAACTHLVVVSGSRAYGLSHAESDVDLKGMAIPPPRYYLGFLKRFEQATAPEHIALFADRLTDEERAVTSRTKLEGTIYELTKLARLAADANPNLLEVLFCRDREVRLSTPIGETLREHARLFVSQRARHTFSGYALAQLKRIRGHRRWLLHPPKGPPTREEYGLPPRTLIPADQLAAAEAAIQKKLDEWELDLSGLDASARVALLGHISTMLAEVTQTSDSRWKNAARSIGLDDNLIAVLDREKRYKARRNDWKQYQTWKRRRNPERAALEAEYGYDTKHGAHLVRLLRMGREILETGEVHVWRGDRDADELQAIRRGEWSYEQLVSWAEAEEEAISALPQERLAVPRHPDLEAIDELVCGLVVRAHGGT